MAQLVGRAFAYNARGPQFSPQHGINLDVVTHVYNPSTWDAEKGESEDQCHLEQYQFKVILLYMILCLRRLKAIDVTAATATNRKLNHH